MSSDAWVVDCAGFKCIIVCFAIDPQAEHGLMEKPPPPQTSAVLSVEFPSAIRFVHGTIEWQDGRCCSCGGFDCGRNTVRGQEITRSLKVVFTISDFIRLVQLGGGSAGKM